MRYFALEDATGRPVSVLPFATLKDVKAYLEWHYPEAPVRLGVDPRGQARFTVADCMVLATDYIDPAA